MNVVKPMLVAAPGREGAIVRATGLVTSNPIQDLTPEDQAMLARRPVDPIREPRR